PVPVRRLDAPRREHHRPVWLQCRGRRGRGPGTKAVVGPAPGRARLAAAPPRIGWLAMNIHIHHGDVFLLDVRTRLPFQYGIATMTRAPHAFVRVRLDVDGQPASGIAADLLPPKWFTKDPAKAIEDEIEEMLRVMTHALGLAAGLRAPSPFDAWCRLNEAQ